MRCLTSGYDKLCCRWYLPEVDQLSADFLQERIYLPLRECSQPWTRVSGLTWLQRESQNIGAVREGQVPCDRNEYHEAGDIRIVVGKAECFPRNIRGATDDVSEGGRVAKLERGSKPTWIMP